MPAGPHGEVDSDRLEGRSRAGDGQLVMAVVNRWREKNGPAAYQWPPSHPLIRALVASARGDRNGVRGRELTNLISAEIAIMRLWGFTPSTMGRRLLDLSETVAAVVAEDSFDPCRAGYRPSAGKWST